MKLAIEYLARMFCVNALIIAVRVDLFKPHLPDDTVGDLWGRTLAWAAAAGACWCVAHWMRELRLTRRTK